MELAIHRLSVLLIDPTMTDQQFTEEVLFIKSFPFQSLFVLPYNIIRAKQLLAGSAIQIASFVDFPLGNGTVAKKSFETGQLYREERLICLYHYLKGKLKRYIMKPISVWSNFLLVIIQWGFF